VVIPFFSFRIMVGCGMVMLGLAWLGTYLKFQAAAGAQSPPALGDFPELSTALHRHPHRLVHGRSRPSALGGYGVLRTADAMTPFLTTRAATISLVIFCAILRLHIRIRHVLHLSPHPHRSRWQAVRVPRLAVPSRPMPLGDAGLTHEPGHAGAGE